MRRLRRTPITPRIELIPLIDVMTFLLTYFIFATATLMRVDLVPMQLRSFSSGKAATAAPAVTIAVDLEGRVFVDRDRIELAQLADRIREKVAKDRKTVVYLAIADGQGKVDRAPLLQELWDRLRPLNITVNLVGRPGMGGGARPAPGSAPGGAAGAGGAAAGAGSGASPAGPGAGTP
ncbi:MAG: biopolymer transporter ExbD [Phycisphaerales bacterium]